MSAIDKLKNSAQEAAGKLKQGVGDKTDNPDLQAEGAKDEASGDLKNRGENLKDAFRS